MTKKEFLAELENALEGKLPADEVKEIIADYKEIFDCGLSDGKREEEISQEIASPAKIARKILDDEPLNTQGKRSRSSFNFNKESYVNSQNIVPLLKRFGAYVIDTGVGALFLVAILFVLFFPFSTKEIVVRVEGAHAKYEHGYAAKLYEDEKGVRTRVEVRDAAEKRIFKGSQEEFVDFLDKNGTRYPEDFAMRTYVRTVREPLPGRTIMLIFGLLLFTGAGNIFNAFTIWKFKGYTLGKKLFKVRVEKADGTELAFTDALLREVVVKSLGNTVTGGLMNLGSFVCTCVTREQKAIHDLAAKTRVVEAKG